MPASIKVASSNGDVDTLAVKEWVAKNPPKPTAPLQGFVTHYNDSQEAYKKMRDLATEFPNISQAIKLPEQTFGYQRKAQTMLGYQADVVHHVRRQQPARRRRGAGHGQPAAAPSS